jgi:CubicO group peptidase (beta-lactamase class C family)
MQPTHANRLDYLIAAVYRVLIVTLACIAATCNARAVGFDETARQQIDQVIQEAIALNKCPGAVLYIGSHDQPVHRKAYGQRTVQPSGAPMTVDTIFDLASLSKPVGCSTSIVILADRGKLSVSDQVAKYLPAFGNHGKEDITIAQLLLHQGGLIPDNPLADFDQGAEGGLAAIYNSSPKWPAGSRFAYSDVGFIVLGEVVKAVDGRSLDRFTREEVFEPLGMKDTGYNPSAALVGRIAATQMRGGKWVANQVHDPRAAAMGGVAGHAGVFSTADDLARFCRMVIHKGSLDGKRILSEHAVEEWTRSRPLADGTGSRTYGFDADTPYSQPRGERFERGSTFGHTGFTGTSLWIDPAHEWFVILLTNAVHPDGNGNVLAIRRKVSTLAAEALLGPRPATQASPAK